MRSLNHKYAGRLRKLEAPLWRESCTRDLDALGTTAKPLWPAAFSPTTDDWDATWAALKGQLIACIIYRYLLALAFLSSHAQGYSAPDVYDSTLDAHRARWEPMAEKNSICTVQTCISSMSFA